jgi:carboxypeptidase Taq
MASKVYDDFLKQVKEIYILNQAKSVLRWDQETYMPPGASPDRAGQLSLLSELVHKRLTSKAMGELLKKLEKDKGLDEDQKVIVREIARDYRREVSIPPDLVREISETEVHSYEAWVKARKANDFKSFEPWLEKMIGLKIRVADCIGYQDTPYDALLDDYEPYMKTSDVRELLARFRKKLVPVASKIIEAASGTDDSILKGKYDIEKQKTFCMSVAEDLGYDFNQGRLDVTAHPFTIGSDRDVRITTRYYEDDMRMGLFGTVHETGHGLYAQGALEKYYLTPLSDAISLGIHESQSRMYENIVARGLPFWKHYFKKLQATFPLLEKVKLEDFHRAINIPRPSFIRVEADEVTYNLHILLRFEIEVDICEGKIKASELPAIWNEKFQEFIGLTPPNDADGCMQDVHWSMGLIGYFPTYTLGNLYSVQIFNKICTEIPDLEQQFEQGRFEGLTGWLRENVHKHGKRYPATELINRITGEGLNEDHFIKYLKEKYGSLYGVSF